MARITEGCCFIAFLPRVALTLSSKWRLISGGGRDRATTSLSSVMSWPKNRLLKSRCLSNRGASRLSLITELARLVPLIDKRVLLDPRWMGLGGGAGLGAGVGLEGFKVDLAGDGLDELNDLGKVLDEEWTFQVRPSKVVLDGSFGMFKLDMDLLTSLIEDWLLGLRGGLTGGPWVLVFEVLDKVALDRVAYKDFMESKKLGFGVELALCSDPGALLDVSL